MRTSAVFPGVTEGTAFPAQRPHACCRWHGRVDLTACHRGALISPGGCPTVAQALLLAGPSSVTPACPPLPFQPDPFCLLPLPRPVAGTALRGEGDWRPRGPGRKARSLLCAGHGPAAGGCGRSPLNLRVVLEKGLTRRCHPSLPTPHRAGSPAGVHAARPCEAHLARNREASNQSPGPGA